MRLKYLLQFVAFSVLVACTLSCTSSQSNYKVLSTFFDGVPNPDLVDSARRADSIRQVQVENKLAQTTQTVDAFFHPPFREKECDICHNKSQMGKLNEQLPALCYNCHEDFNDKYAYVHGPVSAGYCTQCHNPHMSKNENLIIRKGHDLCLHCHQERDVFKNDAHFELEGANCTECHNPHGGDDRYIFN